MSLTRISLRALVILAPALLTACAGVLPSVFDSEVRSYLAANAVEFDAAPTEAAFTALDSVYGSYEGSVRVILSGERHATAMNFPVTHTLFGYFHDRFGVRSYLSEKGVASAYLVDHFIRTGDAAVLEAMMSMISYSSAYSAEQAESLRFLHSMWNDLPETERFRYIGVDVEHALSAPIAAISLIVADHGADAPAALAAIAQRAATYWADGFPSWGSEDETTVRSFVTDLAASLQTDPEVASYLAADLEIVALMTDSAISAYEFYDLYRDDRREEGDALREAAILDHFERHNALAPNPVSEVYYGQWGGFHVNRSPVYGDRPFAALLDEPGGALPGQVLSTAIYYDESRYMDTGSGSARRIEDPSGRYIGAVVKGPVSVVRFDLPDSPFARLCYFVDGADQAQATTDYVQVGLLVRGSEAVTRYGE